MGREWSFFEPQIPWLAGFHCLHVSRRRIERPFDLFQRGFAKLERLGEFGAETRNTGRFRGIRKGLEGMDQVLHRPITHGRISLSRCVDTRPAHQVSPSIPQMTHARSHCGIRASVPEPLAGGSRYGCRRTVTSGNKLRNRLLTRPKRLHRLVSRDRDRSAMTHLGSVLGAQSIRFLSHARRGSGLLRLYNQDR